MSRKGALSHRKNGCLHVEAHVESVLINNCKENDDTITNDIELPSCSGTKAVQGSQHGGSTVLLSITADSDADGTPPSSLVEDAFSPTTDCLHSITPTLPTTSSVESVGIEWLKATVDHDLVHIGFDATKTASSEVDNQTQMGDKAREINDLFTSAVSMPTCVSLLSSSSSISSLSQSSTTSNAIATVPEVSSKRPCNSVATSEADTVAGRLSLQERACLEEIERGSQLTQEERELFESHGLQVLEFASVQPDKSNTLMTAQELESMPDQGLEFEASVGPKHAHFTPETVMTLVQDPPNHNSDDILSDSTTHLVLETPVGQRLVQIERAPLDPSLAEKMGYYAIPVSPKVDASSIQEDVEMGVEPAESAPVLASTSMEGPSIERTPMLEDHSMADTSIEGTPTGHDQMDTTQLADGHMDESGMDESEMEVTQLEDTQVASTDGSQLNAVGSTENAEKAVPEKRWSCEHEGCGQVFTRPYKLRLHTMTHTDERPYKCSEPGCSWAFTTGYKLKRHEEAHRGMKGFVCDVEGCNRRFTTIYNLRSHRKLHARPCTERCPEAGCNESFATKKQLVIHMKVHNAGEKTFKCPHEGCDKWFSSPYCMGSHTRVHADGGSSDLRCPIESCGRVFDKRCRLRQHVRGHTGERPYVCSVAECGWAFSSASKLKRHLYKHTGERKWLCPHPGCGKAFMRGEHLKGHLVTHTGQKPFACPYTDCTASFTAKSSMYVHVRKHTTGEVGNNQKIVYLCPLEDCYKRYTSKNALRNHLVKHVQRQYQNTLVPNDLSLIPLLNPDDLQVNLEGLAQAQVATADGVVASSIFTTPDGSAVINPSDLISTVDSSGSTSYINVISPPVISITPAAAQVSGVVTWLTNETVAQTINQVAGIRVKNDPAAEVTTKKEATPGVGSARTDYHSNCLLLDRVKQRRQRQREPAATTSMTSSNVSLESEPDISSRLTSGLSTPLSVLNTASSGTNTPPIDGCSAPLIDPNEVVTSRAITFRDPETGAIYVQTQLLQDDPPNPEVFSEAGSLVTNEQGMLNTADFTSLLHENELVTGFTCTTINLQDLE